MRIVRRAATSPRDSTPGASFTMGTRQPKRRRRAAPDAVGGGGGAPPLVWVIRAPRARPAFLHFPFPRPRRECSPRRDLRGVDEGARPPADPELVAAAGGRLVHTAPDTTIGE